MSSITELRKFRIQSEYPFINNQGLGIALFDLISTFVAAYLIELIIKKWFGILLNRPVYYLSLIPLGIIIHIFFKQNTFLNRQIFSKELNIYQVLLLLNIYFIVYFLQK
jgi:hypothetical protein